MLTPTRLPDFLEGAYSGRIDAATLLAVVALSVFPGVIGYTCWNFVIGELGAARASQYLFLVPPVTLLLSFTFLSETPGWFSFAGGAIAVLGVAIANVRIAKQTASTANE
jgi:drug/metabolite transporter (DMT)-like permease